MVGAGSKRWASSLGSPPSLTLYVQSKKSTDSSTRPTFILFKEESNYELGVRNKLNLLSNVVSSIIGIVTFS